MTARFVLDESSWAAAAEVEIGVLSNAIEYLLARLDVAHERNEGVVRHATYYEADLGEGVKLYSVLFEIGCRVQLDRDLAERLRLALDRVNEFDDSELRDFDANIAGNNHFAPGVVWAHTCCLQRRHTAILPLPLRDIPHGRVRVAVASATTDVFFVTQECHHVEFFRAIIKLENANKANFERLAPSAFPAIEWADNVWSGLSDFSRPYIAVRDDLVRCLGGLSDHGAACFHEHGADDPRSLERRLSAKIGCAMSDENGRTKRYKPSERDRTRSHQGTNKVFWWHVKLLPQVDRIHFLYEPPSASSPSSEHGQIVVGLFKEHCILPS